MRNESTALYLVDPKINNGPRIEITKCIRIVLLFVQENIVDCNVQNALRILWKLEYLEIIYIYEFSILYIRLNMLFLMST